MFFFFFRILFSDSVPDPFHVLDPVPVQVPVFARDFVFWKFFHGGIVIELLLNNKLLYLLQCGVTMYLQCCYKVLSITMLLQVR